MPEPRKLRTPLAIVAAVLALIAVWVNRPTHEAVTNPNRSESLREAALRIVHAAETGNADALLKYEDDAEINALSLTREKLDHLSKMLVEPALNQAEKNKAALESNNQYQALYIMSQGYVRKNGAVTSLEFGVYATPSGPRAKLIFSLVFGSIMGLYSDPDSLFEPKQRKVLAFYKGLKQTKGELEAAGIRGFVQEGSENRLVTWDEYLDYLKQRMLNDPKLATQLKG